MTPTIVYKDGSPVLVIGAPGATRIITSIAQVIVNVVILVAALACLLLAMKLSSLVRGGALARGWQLWVFSFLALAVGQLLILAEKFDVFVIGFDLAAVLYLVTVALWLAGLVQTRKVLE